MTQKVYIGDTGTSVILDCGQDISSATARTIEVKKPDGSTTTWTASASGTTAISYTSVSGTFDVAGEWRLQAKVTLPSGVWRGETASLYVWPVFG